MGYEKKPASEPDEMVPDNATPHNPGISPKPVDTTGDSAPVDGAHYEKKQDPAQQPS